MLSPNIYEVHHPWHWLTYGQNASALQAVAAVVAAVAAVAAGIYAARAYGAANTQVEVVREQLRLQREESAEATRRYEEEKALREQEREEAKTKANAQRQQLIADEDASRPRFKNTSAWSKAPQQSLTFKNVGLSLAQNVHFTSPVTGKLLLQRDFVASDGMISGTFDGAEMAKEGVLITFKNHRGTEWTVRYILDSSSGGDEVVAVHRPWDIMQETS